MGIKLFAAALWPQRDRLSMCHTLCAPQATSSRGWTTESLREWLFLLYPVKACWLFSCTEIWCGGYLLLSRLYLVERPQLRHGCVKHTHHRLLSVIRVDSRMRRGRKTQDRDLAVDLMHARVVRRAFFCFRAFLFCATGAKKVYIKVQGLGPNTLVFVASSPHASFLGRASLVMDNILAVNHRGVWWNVNIFFND